tara:strand:+ start:105 stop:1034 length:930 start_codon:yes stop_codon:yes gene_type:complete
MEIRVINVSYDDLNILITGHRGYLGSVLLSELKKLNSSVREFSGDVGSIEDWYENIDNIDIIFHLAAIEYSATDNPYRDLDVNGKSVLHMLEACKSKKVYPRVVFASSSNIFGKSDSLPVSESHKDTPASIWSAHKLLSEHYLSIYSHSLGITASCLRLSNVYGKSSTPSLTRRMSLNKMISMAVDKSSLKLFNNSICIRDWVYIDDVISAFLLAGKINDKSFNSFLIGSESCNTISQTASIIVEKIRDLYERDVQVEDVKDVKLSQMAMRNYFPDCSSFKNKTGWSPRHDIESGIELTVRYFNGLRDV